MEGFQFEMGAANRRALKDRGCREAVEREIILAIRQSLTEKQRETFIMYYARRMSMPQIAKLRGVSVPTVSRTLKRARQRIDDRVCAVIERR